VLGVDRLLVNGRLQSPLEFGIEAILRNLDQSTDDDDDDDGDFQLMDDDDDDEHLRVLVRYSDDEEVFYDRITGERLTGIYEHENASICSIIRFGNSFEAWRFINHMSQRYYRRHWMTNDVDNAFEIVVVVCLCRFWEGSFISYRSVEQLEIASVGNLLQCFIRDKVWTLCVEFPRESGEATDIPSSVVIGNMRLDSTLLVHTTFAMVMTVILPMGVDEPCHRPFEALRLWIRHHHHPPRLSLDIV
jgi:hypothetical protein